MSIRRRFGALGLGMGLGGGGGVIIDPDAQTFIDRVLADGGTVEDAGFLNSFVLNAKANNYWNDIVAAYSPSWGVKGTTTASTLYSIIGEPQDLVQSVGANQPTINKNAVNGKTVLTGDGTDDFYERAFALVQPETVMLGGFNQISWSSGDVVHDGSVSRGALIQQTTTPGLAPFAGTGWTGGLENGVTVGAYHHNRVLFNGASSEIQVDGTAKKVGDSGLSNMGGFSLFANVANSSNSNVDIGMSIILDAAVDAGYDAKVAAIYNFSKSAYGTA